jgi:tetratricopeptide (TPR) repeat protein
MAETLSTLSPIHIDIYQPGDKGSFHIDVFDGKNRRKICENRLPEERSILEYLYTTRLLESGVAVGSEQAQQQIKFRQDDLVRYGQGLYNDLFGKGDHFKRYLAKQPHLQNGAQIVLRLQNTASELWNIPWEYMHDGTNFIGIQPRYLITRSLTDTKLERPNLDLTKLPCPLRVLLVIAHPKDAPPLNVDTEIAMIRRAVKPAERAGLLEVDFVEEGTLENLEQALSSNDYHILHYAGHGSVLPIGSCLMLEDEHGLSRPVFVHQLLPLVQKSSSLRFVFLNACKAGTITATKASSGIAAGLLQAVPAVLSMQFSVNDYSATLLAEAFYGSLGNGGTLEEALHAARRTLHSKNPAFGDWGVPALYTHQPNIRLLNPKAARTSTRLPTRQDLSQLPAVEPFVGRREDLRLIRAALPNPQIRSIYLWGMAGIGKSALVRQALERPGRRNLLQGVCILRCDTMDLQQIVTRITTWISEQFPQAASVLTDRTLDPVKRLMAAAQFVQGKRLVLVLDGIERVLQVQPDRHGEFPHPMLVAYFRALATAEWSILTIFTSRLRWSQLPHLPETSTLEIHLGSLPLMDVIFLLQNLPHLKNTDHKMINEFFSKVGGHAHTMHYINQYLAENPQNNPLADPQMPVRLAAWWHKLFLADVFKLLQAGEREALKLLSVYGDVFNPSHIQLIVNLPNQEAAEQIIVGWESLSLASYLDTDEEGMPWYIVPNLVQTYVRSQLKPETLQRSHAEVARMIQRNFFQGAMARFERFGGPRPNPRDEFGSVIDNLRLMLKRIPAPLAHRYVQLAYTWHNHFREANDPVRANDIAMAMLPNTWILQDYELGRKLVETLLQNTSGTGDQHLTARFWEASYAMEAGELPKALNLLQKLEGLAKQHFPELLPEVLARQGEVYSRQGDHRKAQDVWYHTIQAYKNTDHQTGIAHTMLLGAENLYFYGDDASTGRVIETALNLLSKADPLDVDLRVVARLLLYRGHLLRRVRNDQAALECYQEVQQLGAQLKEGWVIAKGMEFSGYVFGLLGQYELGARYLLEAIDIYEKIGDMAGLAAAQTRLAMVYDYKGNVTEARVFCERALQLAAQHSPAMIKQTQDLLTKIKSKSKGKKWFA